jgi:hypothetical protein
LNTAVLLDTIYSLCLIYLLCLLGLTITKNSKYWDSNVTWHLRFTTTLLVVPLTVICRQDDS